jgi:hypothetical protein
MADAVRGFREFAIFFLEETSGLRGTGVLSGRLGSIERLRSSATGRNGFVDMIRLLPC